jgi:nicotinamidase/pyrazinamidase
VARGITELLTADPDYAHIVATKDFHIEPGGHFSEQPDYAASWPRHCEAHTRGAEFHPEFDPGAVEAVFLKGQYSPAYSGFEGADDTGTSLTDWLRARGVDQVDIGGIATDYCVVATATDAIKAGFSTRVLLGLTAGVAQESTARAIEEMRAAGIDVA